MNKKVSLVVNKILEGADVRNVLAEADTAGTYFKFSSEYDFVDALAGLFINGTKVKNLRSKISCNPGDVVEIRLKNLEREPLWYVRYAGSQYDQELGTGNVISFKVPKGAVGGASFDVFDSSTAYNGVFCTAFIIMLDDNSAGWLSKIKIDNSKLEDPEKKFPEKKHKIVADESSFENWWDTVKDDFMTGGEEFFGFDPYEDASINWGVKLLKDDVILYGDIDGVSIKMQDFKDLLRQSGINVGSDVKVIKDASTGGFKVEFKKMSPEEFLEKVW